MLYSVNTIILVLMAILAGCASSPLDSPLESINEPVVSSDSGLRYIDIEVGSASSPVIGSTVTIHFTLQLTDGKPVGSSLDRDEPLTFQAGVGQVIKGLDEGIMTMRVSGKRLLVIPPELAYGKRGLADIIPPDATLILYVILLDVI